MCSIENNNQTHTQRSKLQQFWQRIFHFGCKLYLICLCLCVYVFGTRLRRIEVHSYKIYSTKAAVDAELTQHFIYSTYIQTIGLDATDGHSGNEAKEKYLTPCAEVNPIKLYV